MRMPASPGYLRLHQAAGPGLWGRAQGSLTCHAAALAWGGPSAWGGVSKPGGPSAWGGVPKPGDPSAWARVPKPGDPSACRGVPKPGVPSAWAGVPKPGGPSAQSGVCGACRGSFQAPGPALPSSALSVDVGLAAFPSCTGPRPYALPPTPSRADMAVLTAFLSAPVPTAFLSAPVLHEPTALPPGFPGASGRPPSFTGDVWPCPCCPGLSLGLGYLG